MRFHDQQHNFEASSSTDKLRDSEQWPQQMIRNVAEKPYTRLDLLLYKIYLGNITLYMYVAVKSGRKMHGLMSVVPRRGNMRHQEYDAVPQLFMLSPRRSGVAAIRQHTHTHDNCRQGKLSCHRRATTPLLFY